MKAVVDTNVVAYYLFGTPEFSQEAVRFWRTVQTPTAPALWEAELANVAWMATRAGVMDRTEALRKLSFARRLGIRSVSSRTLWQGALTRAIRSNVAVYDTLFVELAARRRIPFATFDRALLEAFPEIAYRPGTLADRS